MEVYIQMSVTSKLKPEYHSIHLGMPLYDEFSIISKSNSRLLAASATLTRAMTIPMGPAARTDATPTLSANRVL